MKVFDFVCLAIGISLLYNSLINNNDYEYAIHKTVGKLLNNSEDREWVKE